MALIPLAVIFCLIQDPLSDARLDVKVNLRQEACALPRLVTALGVASNVKLNAVSSLEDQVVLVDVHDARLGDAMSKIADVTDCEWKPESDGFTLYPSKAKRDTSAKLELQLRLKTIANVFAQYKEISDSPYDASAVANYLKDQARRSNDSQSMLGLTAEEFTVKNQYGSGLPAGRSFSRALLTVDPLLLASLRGDERIVFSTSPTKLQRKLPVDVAAEVRLRASDNIVYQKGIELAGFSEESVSRVDTKPESSPVTYGKIELIASRQQVWFGLDTLNLQCCFFDDKGQIADQYENMVPLEGNKLAMFGEDAQSDIKPKYETRPDSLWHWKMLTSLMGESTPDTSDPRIGTILAHPEKFDPLSYLTSDALIAMSRDAATNLIAEVDDFALVLSSTRGADGSDFSFFRKRLLASCFNDLSKDPSWLLLQPQSVTTERECRVDRAGLGAFLRGSDQASLASVSEYAAKRRAMSTINLVELTYLTAKSGGRGLDGLSAIDSLTQPALAYIGSLDPATKVAFLNGAKLVYGRSPEPQKRMLERLALGATGVETLTFDEVAVPAEGFDGSEPNREPTDIMPTGIPFDATAAMTHTDAPVLTTLSDDGKSWRPIENTELAMYLAVRINPKIKQPGNDRPMPTKFRFTAKRTYDFRFYVAPKAYYGLTYDEPLPQSNSPVLSYEQLPATVRNAIESTARDIAESGQGELPEVETPTRGGTTGGGGGSPVTW